MSIDENNQTNLIINYLPQTLTDDEFRNMFLAIGPVNTWKVVRDKTSGYSYGFGFVDYQKREDAQRAIQTLNGLQISNKSIKVALARPSGDSIKGANLYISKLPKSYTQDDLNQLFRKFGSIIQSRILVDQATGISKGVGFVLYDQKAQAENAIAEMNGFTPPGSPEGIVVKFADDTAKKQKKEEYLQNIQFRQSYAAPSQRYPPHIAAASPYQSSLMGAASPGPIRNQSGSRFRYNPMSSGGGSSAIPVALNYTPPPSSSSYTPSTYTPNTGMGAGDAGHVLYIYNIGPYAGEKALVQLFSPFGQVMKVNIIMDHVQGQNKGYGFITMANYNEAQNAIFNLNGYDFQGNGHPLQVSFKTAKK